MCSITNATADRRTHKLEMLLTLAGILGCLQGAYYTYKGLPLFLQMNSPVPSIFFFFLSVILICEGIFYLMPPLNPFLGRIFVRGKKIFGGGCLSLGVAILLLWLNRFFDIYAALHASFLAFVTASVLFGLNLARLAFLLRAGKGPEGK